MNELQIINTTDRTPIEVLLQVGEDDRVSARDVYEFLGLLYKNFSEWCKRNISENEFAESGADYYEVLIEKDAVTPSGGAYKTAAQDYRLSIPFAKKLCMLSRTERGEQARDYFIKVENTLKTVAQRLPQLSTNEILLQTLQSMVEVERKQAVLEERMETTEQLLLETGSKFETALQVFAAPSGNWKDHMELAIREMVGDGKFSLIKYKGILYTELEAIASCDLTSRQSRLKARMKKQGATYRERNAITKLDVISRDKNLRPVFESIVRRKQAAQTSSRAT